MVEHEEIMNKSLELGKSIAQTAIYKEFKKAEYDLLHNPEARKIVEDMQKMKQKQHGKKMAGIEVSKEELETLSDLEKRCLRDRQVLSSNEANTKFQDFMEQISGSIKNGITSIDQ